jgi:hypothetical protein|eukprot:COSAG06_NODE_1690_length_8706_cov_4.248170_3_plen_846_part_00
MRSSALLLALGAQLLTGASAQRGDECDPITMEAQVRSTAVYGASLAPRLPSSSHTCAALQVALMEHLCCAHGQTMAAGNCALPDVCSGKCGQGYLPFFEGGCFDQTLEQMTEQMADDFLRFGDLCAANVAECPRAELAQRIDEVNTVCPANPANEGHRRAQAGGAPVIDALPVSCSPDCAPIYSQFYVDCFEMANLETKRGAAALYVKCARLSLSETVSSQRGCSFHTDCTPDDLGLVFALDAACPASETPTRWNNIAVVGRSDESLSAELDSVGCYHDCGTHANGAAMDRVCDDLGNANVQSPEECRARCQDAGFSMFALGCPQAASVECACCNTLDANDQGEDGRIPDEECAGGSLSSGINGNRQDHCSGMALDTVDPGSGGYVIGGYPLGGYCRVSVFNTVAPPPPPPQTFDHLGVSNSDLTYDPNEGGGSYLFDGVFETVELNISPSYFEAFTLEIWFKLNSYNGRDEANDAGGPGWIVGHDDSGFDRAICLHDSRYGGIAGPNGGTYQSTLGYPEVGAWTHVVATFQNGVNCPVYRHDAAHQLIDHRMVQNGDGDPQFSVGGLENYDGHIVDAYIAEVRTYDRILSYEEVDARYRSTCDRYGACPVSQVGTAAACTTQDPQLVFALDAACQGYVASTGMDTSTTWSSIAGDTSIGLSTAQIQYDAHEGQGAFLFDNVAEPVALDISPAAYPALSIELWVRVNSFAGSSNGWVVGHDNGGYDRAICLHDARYGGIAGPNGGTYTSVLGPPEIGEWTHIVATFENGVDSKVYRDDRTHHLQDSRVTNNDGGEASFTIGGLANFGDHHVDAYISEVRIYSKRLSDDEVRARYDATCERYNACS